MNTRHTKLCDQLLAIREQRGELTPELVVDAARDPEHPLHSRFEWDDAVAGEAWRREQAHDLIRKAKIVYCEPGDGQPSLIRAFIAVPKQDGYAFDPVQEVAEDPFRRQLVLNAMEREWKALLQRYKEHQGFFEMVRGDVGDAA
jgi:hypothetical protein